MRKYRQEHLDAAESLKGAAGALRRMALFDVALDRRVAHRLDVDPIRIEHKRAIVVGVIMRPHARAAVVPPARRHGGRVESVHLRAGLGAEGDMHGPAAWAVGVQPEDWAGRRTVADVGRTPG